MKKLAMFLMASALIAMTMGCASTKRIVYRAVPKVSVNTNIPWFFTTTITVRNNFPGKSGYIVYIEVDGGLAIDQNGIPLQIFPGDSAPIYQKAPTNYGNQISVTAKVYRHGNYVGKKSQPFYASGTFSQGYELSVDSDNIQWAK